MLGVRDKRLEQKCSWSMDLGIPISSFIKQ